jgi:hypothetical protein
MPRRSKRLKKPTFENRLLFLPGRSQRKGLAAQRRGKNPRIVFILTWTFMKKSAKRARADASTQNTITTLKIVFTHWAFLKNSAKRARAEALTINTKTSLKIVFTLTWTFMKNSAKRAKAEASTINTKTTFKNRLYTNLDIHEE